MEEEWLSRHTAIERLAQEFGLTGGAAEHEYRAAINTDKVRLDAITPLGRERVSPSDLSNPLLSLTGSIRDLRANWGDLLAVVRERRTVPRRNPRGAGRPPANHWLRIHKFAQKWLEDNGCGEPGDQAKLEKAMADLLGDSAPVESTIRKHAVRQIEIFKERREAGN